MQKTQLEAFKERYGGAVRQVFGGLSGRVLLFTIGFVMVAEAVVFFPSLAAFQRNWLTEKSREAEIALVAAEATTDPATLEALHLGLLRQAGVHFAARRDADGREMRIEGMTAAAPPGRVRTIDLRRHYALPSIMSAYQTMVGSEDDELNIIAKAAAPEGAIINLRLRSKPLQDALQAFGARVFGLSILISVITAVLMFSVLRWTVVRPILRLTNHIERFRERPDDATRAIEPSGRRDEIGRAELALAEMEEQVRAALRQQQRLAGLGAAVARIAHDLRNSLATAQIVSDRLAASEDPTVRQVAPRLERAIERASGLAQAALRYGRAEEPEPQLFPVELAEAIQEAAADALAPFPQVRFESAAPGEVLALVDADFLHRIMLNLMRNAAQAMTGPEASPGREPALSVRLEDHVEGIRLVFEDNGPGVPAIVQERLFEPFATAQRPGGSGLGLAIARELARAQGGDLRLRDSSERGAVFELTLTRAPAL